MSADDHDKTPFSDDEVTNVLLNVLPKSIDSTQVLENIDPTQVLQIAQINRRKNSNPINWRGIPCIVKTGGALGANGIKREVSFWNHLDELNPYLNCISRPIGTVDLNDDFTLGICENPKGIIYPELPGFTVLRDWLKKPDEFNIYPKAILNILNFLEKLYELKISHGDLTPNNIYINQNSEVVIVDWETWQNDDEVGESLTYHRSYFPPELLLKSMLVYAKDTNYSDINMNDIKEAYVHEGGQIDLQKTLYNIYINIKGRKITRSDIDGFIDQETYEFVVIEKNQLDRFGLDFYTLILPFGEFMLKRFNDRVLIDFLKSDPPQRKLTRDHSEYVREYISRMHYLYPNHFPPVSNYNRKRLHYLYPNYFAPEH